MAEDRRSLGEGFSEGAGLAMVFAAVLIWAVLAQVSQEPPIHIPTSHTVVLRP